MWSLHPMAQLENSNIYTCKQNPRRGRVGCTMHLVFANKIINRGLCSRAFCSNPRTCSTPTLLTRGETHGSHHSTRFFLFLSLNLLAHVNPCTAWHHGNPNLNHQKATRTLHLTLLSHKCGVVRIRSIGESTRVKPMEIIAPRPICSCASGYETFSGCQQFGTAAPFSTWGPIAARHVLPRLPRGKLFFSHM